MKFGPVLLEHNLREVEVHHDSLSRMAVPPSSPFLSDYLSRSAGHCHADPEQPVLITSNELIYSRCHMCVVWLCVEDYIFDVPERSELLCG